MIFPHSVGRNNFTRFQASLEIIVQRQAFANVRQRHVIALRRFAAATAGIGEIDMQFITVSGKGNTHRAWLAGRFDAVIDGILEQWLQHQRRHFHVGRLENPPAIIFVTAYDSYAVKAFELNAIDYLVKPVRAQRLAAALQKVRSIRPTAPQVLAELQQGARTHLSCNERGRLLLIPVRDILYLRADLKYVTARTAAREYLLDESLTHLEQEFSERFIRLHRSVLVAREAIAGFEKCAGEEAEAQWQALLHGIPERLPVSRRQWPLVKSYARQMSS